jgi:hypothetical protein
MGYFERAVGNLRHVLEDHPRLPKLAQIHSHLILSFLAAIPAFDDPYSIDFGTQRTLFIKAVQRARRDIDSILIEEVLPRDMKHARPAFINLIGGAGGGPASLVEKSSSTVTESLGQ